MAKTTNDFELAEESGGGKLFNTGDDKIQVLQLQGSWHEMGQQYGAFAQGKLQPLWDSQVQPVLDKKWMSEEDALDLFGHRVYATASQRIKDLYRGVADGLGWPVEKVVLLDQSAQMGMFQGKLHAFAGCSSLCSWGDATKDGNTYTGRNMDWGKAFLEFPVFYTVYNPTDGSNGIANLNWAGWLWAMSAVNDKGVYADIHDGTSMGGLVVSLDRPSFPAAVLDYLAECDTSEALGMRFNAAKTDVCFIWTVADKSGNCFSYESTLFDNRRRNAEGSNLAVVNSFLNPDWGFYTRDTVSNSLTRYKNLMARAAEAHGQIDADKTMDIFDLPLFNEDGTFKKNGGATKPTQLDADLTDHQIVTNLGTLDTWVKIPLQTEWRHVDLKALFTA